MGFLPSKAKARGDALAEVAGVRASLAFYESGPRCADSLAAMADVLGDRLAALCREISKLHETTLTGALSELAASCAGKEPKGEIVIVVGPPGEAPPAEADEVEAALVEALARLSASQAATEVARSLGADRKALYARAMELKGKA